METSKDKFYFQQKEEGHEENRKRIVVRQSFHNVTSGTQAFARAPQYLQRSLRSSQISSYCSKTPMNLETTRVFVQHISVCAELYFCFDFVDCDSCNNLRRRYVDADRSCEVPLCSIWTHCLHSSRNRSESNPSPRFSRQETACDYSKHQGSNCVGSKNRSSPSIRRDCRKSELSSYLRDSSIACCICHA